jgi:hypothetical protein
MILISGNMIPILIKPFGGIGKGDTLLFQGAIWTLVLDGEDP